MKVSEVGEFGLIARLSSIAGEPPPDEVWIGDDAAVLPGGLLLTADMLVESVHFDLALASPRDIGFKSIAVNVSDIAAMAGEPRYATVSLGLTGSLDLDWVEDLYRGMRDCFDSLNLEKIPAIVGGDVSRSPSIVISVALIGKVLSSPVLRSGARVGDAVCVTGTLGASAVGLRALREGTKGLDDAKQRHLRPAPRLAEAQVIAEFSPTAMIDVSDGFAADLGHICDASNVGVLIDSSLIPAYDELDLALGGGEDYELCLTMQPDSVDQAAKEILERTGTSLTRVGEVTARERGRVLLVEGDVRPLSIPGWDHLRV